MSLHLAYIDESGDDGIPGASPLFTLSAIYLHYLHWQPVFDQLLDFRRRLKKSHGLPVRAEIHTRPLLRLKKPYNQIFASLPTSQKNQWATAHHWAKDILDQFAQQIAALHWRAINSAIIKNTSPPSTTRWVLDLAVTFLVQRIENDLAPRDHPERRFIIITDPGREAAVRYITRRIRRYNPVPSQFGGVRNIPITSLIEDPLPKDSTQSYFIQAADFIATVVYLYTQIQHTSLAIPPRIERTLLANAPSVANAITGWMDTLTPILNTHASRNNPYGVVTYKMK